MKVNIGKPKENQKIEVQIDSWDTWDMDSTLAPIILPMLIQLKATKHGAPYVDPEDCPDEFMPVSSDSSGVDNTHFERWDWVLDEMIFAFDSKVTDDWEVQFQSGEFDYESKEREDGYSEMIKGPNHTFEIDMEGRKAYGDRIQKGFELFGKYFQSLWD